AEIEQVLASFGREPGGGLIMGQDNFMSIHRKLIIELANRYRLPTIASGRQQAMAGALLCYGVDNVDQYRRAATYVDRILRGDKPSDLPVQQPVKFELVINMKTAKALG